MPNNNNDVLSLLAASTNISPDACAIEHGDKHLSYKLLTLLSNQVARHLLAAGFQKGQLAALSLNDPLTHIIVLLGIMKAGGIFMPISPSEPLPRLRKLIELTQPIWWINDAATLKTLCSVHDSLAKEQYILLMGAASDGNLELPDAWHVFRLDKPDTTDQTWQPITLGEDDPCYIFFTSGSSGTPKPILGRFKSLSHFIRWEIKEFELDDDCRVSQLTAPTFDAFLRDLFVPLCSGGTLCVPPQSTAEFSADKLIAWLGKARVTLVHCVPSLFRTLLKEQPTDESLSSLQYVLMAGETMSVSDVQRWTDIFSDRIRLVNLYGTTETTLVKFFHRVQASDIKRGFIPIGRPIDNVRAILLDEQQHVCPRGRIGELYLRSSYFSIGYYNQPALSDEVFITNPLTGNPNDIVYRTGDRAMMLEDGNLRLLGRIDRQTKIRGVRVELEEVEAALLKYHGIHHAAVVVQTDAHSENFIQAFFVATAEIKDAQLREFLLTSLPPAMCPSTFTQLDEMPLTATGKIDRISLASRLESPQSSIADVVAPNSDTQTKLVAIWEEVLGVAPIGIHNNFFELGGHSLRALLTISRVRKTFEIELALVSFFSMPTVAELATYIDSERHITASATKRRKIAITPVSRDSDLPLSFGQQRLWFLDQLMPENPFYNISAAVSLHGPAKIDLLHRAVNTVVARHEVLRTVFLSHNGQPRQVVLTQLNIPLPVFDLTEFAHETDKQSAQIDTIIQCETQLPFDLVHGPLLRACAIRIASDQHIILTSMHHIVFDAWSLELLIHEVGLFYDAFSRGESAALPDLSIQYADFANWQRQWFQDEVLATQIDYWRNQLADAPRSLTLPVDRPHSITPSQRGLKHRFSLSKGLTDDLNSLSRDCNATLFMTLMAAYQILLSRFCGQTDICVGTPVANRNHDDLETLIGFFVNTLVIRTQIVGNPKFTDLLEDVRDTSLAAYDHQDLPFEQLVDELHIERDMRYTPLFQAVLALQNTPRSTLALTDGLRLEPVSTDNAIAKTDLDLDLTETDHGLVGFWQYATDIFEPVTIQRMADAFTSLLEQIAAKPSIRLSDIAMLNEHDRHQILHETNTTERSYPADVCVHEIFARIASQNPQSIAATLDGETISYASLNQRANQLAYYLIDQGVGSDTLIGLCMNRSIDMLVAILGILKAGGAYVPLDSDYPQERIMTILRDANVHLLITQGSLQSALPDLPARVLNQLGYQEFQLDTQRDKLAGLADTNPEVAVSPHNLAYIIYTSGSTGKPKGVAISHQAVNRLAFNHFIPFGPDCNLLCAASIAFDAATFELWGAWLHGATVVLFPERVPTAESLADALQQHPVKGAWLTASLFNALVDNAPSALHGIEYLLIGGEALSPAHVQRAYSALPNLHLINGYGPTEATTFACTYAIPRDFDAHRVPIGRPIDNTSVYVLDAQLNPVPVGAPGELYIGGDGLARGYLNQPALTAAVFVPHAFSATPGARLYKTGDRVRYLADGNLEFLGRLDDQVKLRGYRIELGEIEAQLRQHPTVSEAAVLLREDQPGHKRLVAYTVSEHDAAPEADALQRFLRARLPDYMVPSAFAALPALPLTRNGKLDRRQLPVPERLTSSQEYVPPRSTTEQLIADIWQEILDLERVGVHDNFFVLGGNSLTSAHMVSRIRLAFAIDFPLATIFAAPTLGDFSREVEERIEPSCISAPSTDSENNAVALENNT
jgi:amino acid adenylation domain-containing protein